MTLIIAPIVNFLIVFGFLGFYARKPLMAFLANRKANIEKEIGEAEALAKESSRQLAEWETNWNAHEAHARQQMQEAKDAVARQKERGIAAAKAEADRIKKDATLVGQTEAARAKDALGRELVQKSVELARQYLTSSLDEKDKTKLVSDYLELVRTGHAG